MTTLMGDVRSTRFYEIYFFRNIKNKNILPHFEVYAPKEEFLTKLTNLGIKFKSVNDIGEKDWGVNDYFEVILLNPEDINFIPICFIEYEQTFSY